MRSIFVFVFVVMSIFNTLAQEEFKVTEGDTTYIMKQYWFGMLKKGPNRDQDSVAAQKIQSGHLTHLNKMMDMGKLLVAGPFGDDGDWRGILIFDAKSKEEVMELAEQDPAIKSGRLILEVHPWWTAKGSVIK